MKTNETTQNTFTDDEKGLAERYKVEPKLVRLIAEIVGEHTAELNELINLKAEPEQAEPQEQPAEFSIDQQTQQRIKSYFKNLDPRTKLAIATLSDIQALDGLNFQARQKEGKLMDEIWRDIEGECINTFPASEISSEDSWFQGVWEAVRMVVHNT